MFIWLILCIVEYCCVFVLKEMNFFLIVVEREFIKFISGLDYFMFKLVFNFEGEVVVMIR